MSHSYSETTNIICPGCRQEVSVEIWRIVDTQERPDLSARIRKNEIHTVIRGNCGHKGRINAPLLVNVPEKEALFFVRTEKTSEVENRNTRAMLVKKLAASFEEISEYLDTVEILDQDELPRVFRESNERPVQKRVSSSGKNSAAGIDMPGQLHLILSEISQLSQLKDMPRRVELCRQALMLVNRHQNPPLWAMLSGELGNSLQQKSLG